MPKNIIDSLRNLNAEIVHIDSIHGSTAGMFWRFMVADDPSVDRFIVRDTDSRLNARDRFAVEEWVRSNVSTHSIRDHPGHNYPLSGGLWGSTRGAIEVLNCMTESGIHHILKCQSNIMHIIQIRLTEHHGVDPVVEQ